MFVLLRFFFLAAFLTCGLVNAANELDLRLDEENKEDVQRNYLEARNKLQTQVAAAQKEINELTNLVETEKLYGNDISEMVAQALQPLSELVEEKRVLLAARLSGYAQQFSANDWQAGAFNNNGQPFYGSGTTRSNAESSALAKATASEVSAPPPPPPPPPAATVSATYNGFTRTGSTYSMAYNAAVAAYNAAPMITAYYQGFSGQGKTQALATTAAQTAYNNAPMVTAYYQGFSGQGKTQALATTAAQAAYNNAPWITATYQGFAGQGKTSALATAAAQAAYNNAPWITASYQGFTGQGKSLEQANAAARAEYDRAPMITASYQGYTGQGKTQQEASAAAQRAWQVAQPPTWTGNFNGATVTSTVSQADADRLARLNWLSAQIPSGTNVVTETYDTLGWKPITNSSNNLTLNLHACSAADLCIGFKYGANQYVEIVIGALNNTKALVRNYNNSTTPVEVSVAGAVIPTTLSAASYTIKLTPDTTSTDGNLLVTATTLNGVVSTLILIKNAFLNQRFTAYSFRASSTNSWRFTNDLVTSVPLPYTAKYNGIDASSLVSQVDANQKAQDAWGVVEQAINLKVQALQTANTKFSEDFVKTTALAKELIQFFKADPVSSVDTSSWNLP